MAEWKKIITSGSQAELAGITGSLSGSGAGITNVKTSNLSGTITNSQLAGSIANGKLANSTISGVSLGGNLNNLTVDNSSIQLDSGNDYNGSAAKTISVKNGGVTNAMLENDGITIAGVDASLGDTITSATILNDGKDIISGSFTEASASFSTRITNAEANDGDITGVELTGQTGGITIASQTNTTSGDYSATIQLPTALTIPQTIKNDSLVIGRSSANDLITFANGDISLGIGGTEVLGVDSTGVVVTGNLTVNGTTTTVNTTNTLVTDRFMLLNSGSNSGDGGIIVQTENDASGSAFVYNDDQSRWGIQQGTKLGQNASSATGVDGHVAVAVTSDVVAHRKDGNIRVQSGEIFIYVE